MDLNGHHRKWPTAGRRWQHLERVLILFASMSAFSLMMIINIDIYRFNDNSNAVLWTSDLNLEQNSENLKLPIIRQMAMPAMKTIVAYSAEKQAEMDKRYPILCNPPSTLPQNVKKDNGWLDVQDTEVSLYAAYYDDRIRDQPYTRILAAAKGSFFEDTYALYCQTWKKNDGKWILEAVEASITQIWWSEWDPSSTNTTTPILISCALMSPRHETYNTTITLNPCKTNPSTDTALNVKIPKSDQYKTNFTVCVKDMNFEKDISERLIEWFEVLKILGAEYFHMYVTKVPNKVKKVLKLYSKQGLASVHQAPRIIPASQLWQRRRDHLIAYNDCLYRNLKTSRYIIPLDIDEVIVPKQTKTWSEMLKILKPLEDEQPGAASLAISNAFFFDIFNEEIKNIRNIDLKKSAYVPHILTHLRRSSLVSPAPEYSKSFVSTSKALTVFNHYALSALSGAERARAVPEEIALLHHYKSSCQPELVDCQLYTESNVVDDSLLRISNDLKNNINVIFKEI